MFKKILSCVLAIMLVATTMLCTGCGGSTDIDADGKKIDTPQFYQITAVCEGEDIVKGHSNKMTLTSATGSSNAISITDFVILHPFDRITYTLFKATGTNKDGKEVSTTWSGEPLENKTTKIKNLGYTIVEKKIYTVSFDAHWNEMEKTGKSGSYDIYEAKARLTFCN